jgi:hypothetical protein
LLLAVIHMLLLNFFHMQFVKRSWPLGFNLFYKGELELGNYSDKHHE